MASFSISQQDIIIMSFSANFCVLIHFVLARLVDQIMTTVVSKSSSYIGGLADVYRRNPYHLARVLAEQITLWILVVLIFTALTYTTVSSLPFSYQPSPYPSFLISFILGSNATRCMVAAARLVLVRETVVTRDSPTQVTATAGQSGIRRLDILYYILGSASNIVFLGYKQNLLFGVTASLMEVSSTPLECCRLVKLSRRDSESYKKATLVSCITCFACRALLPLVLLLLALRQESPLIMDNVPLVMTFTLGTFFVCYHCLLIYQSVRRVFKPHTRASQSTSPYNYIPFCIQDYPEVMAHEFKSSELRTNDCRPGTAFLLDGLKTAGPDGAKGNNQEFQKSYNRDVCSLPDVKEKDLDALNVVQKNESSNCILLHKIDKDIYRKPSLESLEYTDLTPVIHSSQIALLDNMADNVSDDT
ncbi:hypothetical protein Bpfe_024653 [Biomphalaria pfeifferi]|uniref:Uncharacterized protein n=1 Tax=Biomphalaria pfeifferi TaxID=112525 RepID=A0AAD8B0I4_BIOPF|nr:hypothetical protein Bpfe_024653 [Biomphalaria pfeifferi]